jgi:hypothetical protein
MTRGAVALVLAAGVAAGVLAGCQPVFVEVDRGGFPEQPRADDRVGPATLVAAGDSEAGAFRAWVYRDAQALTCFQVATIDMSATGCGPGDDGVLGISASSASGGWFVAGGTRTAAASAVVHTSDGGQHTAPVRPAPGGVTPGIRYVVVGVTATPNTIDLLDEAGTVLETLPVEP